MRLHCGNFFNVLYWESLSNKETEILDRKIMEYL